MYTFWLNQALFASPPLSVVVVRSLLAIEATPLSVQPVPFPPNPVKEVGAISLGAMARFSVEPVPAVSIPIEAVVAPAAVNSVVVPVSPAGITTLFG